MTSNLIEKKGFEYAVRTAELVRYLQEQEKQFPLSDKLLCCGLETGMRCRYLSKDNRLREREGALEGIKAVDYMIEMAVYAGYLTELQSVHIREEGKKLMQLLQEADQTSA